MLNQKPIIIIKATPSLPGTSKSTGQVIANTGKYWHLSYNQLDCRWPGAITLTYSECLIDEYVN